MSCGVCGVALVCVCVCMCVSIVDCCVVVVGLVWVVGVGGKGVCFRV